MDVQKPGVVKASRVSLENVTRMPARQKSINKFREDGTEKKCILCFKMHVDVKSK